MRVKHRIKLQLFWKILLKGRIRIFLKEKIILLQRKINGALAQLARVFDWQSKGHRFDSDMLHNLHNADF